MFDRYMSRGTSRQEISAAKTERLADMPRPTSQQQVRASEALIPSQAARRTSMLVNATGSVPRSAIKGSQAQPSQIKAAPGLPNNKPAVKIDGLKPHLQKVALKIKWNDKDLQMRTNKK